MQVSPRAQSLKRVLSRLATTLVMVSRKPEAVMFSPRRLFSWDVVIITDVAEVKPTVTGIDMKSIRTPGKRIKSINFIRIINNHSLVYNAKNP